MTLWGKVKAVAMWSIAPVLLVFTTLFIIRSTRLIFTYLLANALLLEIAFLISCLMRDTEMPLKSGFFEG